MTRLQMEVESTDTMDGKFRARHAMIFFVQKQRHFWSPWMHLEFIEPGSGDSGDTAPNTGQTHSPNVIARFSPHPSIWTGIMLTYLSLIVLAFFTLVLGCSQQMASQYPWGYYLMPLWIVTGTVIWLASQIGQRLANQQMNEMLVVVQDCLHEIQN